MPGPETAGKKKAFHIMTARAIIVISCVRCCRLDGVYVCEFVRFDSIATGVLVEIRVQLMIERSQ